MTPKRCAAIIASLSAGNLIHCSWRGGNTGGYLSHRLEGVKCLREKEVEELWIARLIEVVPKYNATFKPYRLASRGAL